MHLRPHIKKQREEAKKDRKSKGKENKRNKKSLKFKQVGEFTLSGTVCRAMREKGWNLMLKFKAKAPTAPEHFGFSESDLPDLLWRSTSTTCFLFEPFPTLFGENDEVGAKHEKQGKSTAFHRDDENYA